MNFSLEIGPHTNLDTLPAIKDIYITLLPGENYIKTAEKAGDLVKKGLIQFHIFQHVQSLTKPN